MGENGTSSTSTSESAPECVAEDVSAPARAFLAARSIDAAAAGAIECAGGAFGIMPESCAFGRWQ
jgi:hypothetical protein